MPLDQRERFREALELVVKAWSAKETFACNGKHYQLPMVNLWPRPIQQPHPPLYMSGSSPEAGELAARQRIGLGFAFTTIGAAAKAAAYYRAQAQAQGWSPTPDDIIYRVGFHVAETD